MINEAIILAGGLGTRLRSAVPHLPKCMAPVAGHPFIYYVINHLRLQGIEHIIFSLGYKAEVILDYLQAFYPTLHYSYIIEEEPLGTGGAIKAALEKCTATDVVIANGDTLYKAPLQPLVEKHTTSQAACTLYVKPLENFDRYGAVNFDNNGVVTGFTEKKYHAKGYINGGVYLLNKQQFLAKPWPQKFSFEQAFLEKVVTERAIQAVPADSYFIDIGIPQDFEKANNDLTVPPLSLKNINKSWTLFLDRDGVINEEKDGEYVLNKEGFNFTTGAAEAIAGCTQVFGRVIVITNQRGVGRGLMQESDLLQIHQHLTEKVSAAGGNIDHIFYNTATESTHILRKPNPGMAAAAFQQFKDIDPQRTIMAGNKLSDMQFGRWAGVYTVYIQSTHPDQPLPHPLIDAAFVSLSAFAGALEH